LLKINLKKARNSSVSFKSYTFSKDEKVKWYIKRKKKDSLTLNFRILH